MTLTEYTRCISQHLFENGKFIDNNQLPDNYLNQIKVECDDCGIEKQFTVSSILKKKAPKWLQERYEQVNNQRLNPKG